VKRQLKITRKGESKRGTISDTKQEGIKSERECKKKYRGTEEKKKTVPCARGGYNGPYFHKRIVLFKLSSEFVGEGREGKKKREKGDSTGQMLESRETW